MKTPVNNSRKIALVYSFPGKVSAEKELSIRYQEAAKNIGYEIIAIDNNGYILNDDMERTDNVLSDHDSLFTIAMHFFDYKVRDSFYYYTVWNPPEIHLSFASAINNNKNVLSNDDFLLYGHGTMVDHIKSILVDDSRDLKNTSCLVGSFPKSRMLAPNLDNPRLFYCGMNWEIGNGKGRHDGLFHKLDENDVINIYGPNKPAGWSKRPWAGYKNYKGEIPFDGFSILKEINKCGIVLAVSSDWHRRAGAVTNRIYEACAAGAVIISDNNPFAIQNFGDSLLYIDFNSYDPQDTYNQIVEKIDWIKSHKDQALRMAKKSQQIFADKFCMENQLQHLIDNHNKRVQVVAESMYAQRKDDKVLVVAYLDDVDTTNNIQKMNHVIEQIQKQTGINVVLVFACDLTIQNDIKSAIPNGIKNVVVAGFEIFNDKKTKMITRGQMLRHILDNNNYDNFVILRGDEILFHNHFTLLKRKLEDNAHAGIAYSGSFVIDGKNNRNLFVYNHIGYDSFYNCDTCAYIPGMFMFSRRVAEYVPSCADTCLDGYEFLAYINRAIWTKQSDIIYSRHVTLGIQQGSQNYISPVLTDEMQKNFIRGFVDYYYSANIATQHIVSGFDKTTEHILKKIARRRLKNKILLERLKKVLSFNRARKNKIKQRIRELANTYNGLK